MNIRYAILVLSLALGIAVGASAQQNELNWTMERAVKQLDRQGSDLESVLADVEIEWTGKDEALAEIKTGRIYFNEKGEFRINVATPSSMTILLERGTVHHYKPDANLVEQYSLSKHKDRLEPFIALGFTTTGKELDDDFLVTFIGENSVGDRRVLGLELTPKRDKVREVVSRIQIWVDESSWLPARQIITHTSGGEVLTVTYRGTARNLDLNPKLFDDSWPRGTDKKRM